MGRACFADIDRRQASGTFYFAFSPRPDIVVGLVLLRAKMLCAMCSMVAYVRAGTMWVLASRALARPPKSRVCWPHLSQDM